MFTIYVSIAFSAILFLPTAFSNFAQIIIPFTYLPRILKKRGTFGVMFTICSYDFVCVHKSLYHFLCAMTEELIKTLFIPYRIFTYKNSVSASGDIGAETLEDRKDNIHLQC